jgi:hypothetical protein
MSFEEALAQCLIAIEQGQSLEDCLAHYPGYSAALAPILRTAIQLRTGPKPRLSDRAFARGRAALAAHAKHQHELYTPFTLTPGQATFATRTKTLPKPTAISPRSLPIPSPIFVRWHQFTGVFIALLLLLSITSFVRTIGTSLPGSPLYPVKIVGENAQGLLMAAAGQQATWHAHQVELRLQEIALLARQGLAVEPTLTTAIDEHLQAALNASADMPAQTRNDFLVTWLDHLHALQQEVPVQSATIATLAQAIATVEAATQEVKAPTVLPLVNTPTVTPSADVPIATETALPLLLPTLTPTDIEIPQTATAVDLATATPEFVTATSPAPEIAATSAGNINGMAGNLPTATQATQLLPLESDNRASGQSSDHGKEAAVSAPTSAAALDNETPMFSVTPTSMTVQPTDATAATTTPDVEHTPSAQTTPDHAEPTDTGAGNLPPTPTAGEPPTPTPSAKSTATGEAAKATESGAKNTETPEPTRTKEGKTSTPEPTKAPIPRETAEATPIPDNDQATPVPDKPATSTPANDQAKPTETPRKRPKK